MHALVAPDFFRRAFDQHHALHEHGDAPREAEHEIHVVLDDEDGDLRRQLAEIAQNELALVRGHAGGGLVEQQHLGLQAERDRDLDQALLAVGQIGDARRRVVREAEGGEVRHRFVA